MKAAFRGEIKSYFLSSREKEEAVEALKRLLAIREEILFAYVHGSFLDEGPFRDLDIAVYVTAGDLPTRRFTYEESLAREIMYQTGLPFPVDIRLLNEAPVGFRYHVFHGRLLLDRDPDLRIEMMVKVIARYLDIEPVLHHHAREAFDSEAQS
ncbi:MAG: nucleotidyltransferase domain-containing protein [Pseudomonadota bacterium]